MSLVILTLTSLWALWLVAPTKSMLVKLISRSTSPEVSLAFLNELKGQEPQSRTIVFMQAQNQYELGLVNDALESLNPILFYSDGRRDWHSHSLFLAILLQQSYSDDAAVKERATTQIATFFSGIDYIPEANLARQFADAAISLAMPTFAYQFLYPHLKSGETSYKELVELALQTSDYENAAKLQREAFMEYQSFESLASLIKLNQSADNTAANLEFFHQYDGKLSNTPQYLALVIQHAKAAGELNLALNKSQQLLAIEPSTPLLLETADIAIAMGNLPLATELLTQAIKDDPTSVALTKLHSVYRWQSDIPNAFQTSLILLQQGANEAHIRAGVEESKALGDIYHEGVFFDSLAYSNALKPSEYAAWLNALEKAKGTPDALRSIIKLSAKRPYDSALISHKARLYSYNSDHLQVIKQRNKLLRLRKPTTDEAMRFANAYMALYQPEQALRVLIEPTEWTTANDDYLRMVAALAWDSSDKQLAQLSQQYLMQRSTANVDVYRYIQLHAPFNVKDVDELTRLYKESGDSEFLLLAIRVSNEAPQSEQTATLFELASKDRDLKNNAEVTYYRALLAIEQGQTVLAHQLYQQAISSEVSFQPAVNSYMWWLIATNDHDKLTRVYDSYRLPLANNSDFWSVFAATAQQLGRNDEADLWYRRQIKATDKPDVALLLNYASLLELREQYDRAYQLRKYAAKNMTASLLTLSDGDISHRALLALFVGDKTALKLAEANTLAAPSSNNVAELIQYYLAQGRPDVALYWHEKTALSQYQLPDWQQLSFAIAQHDRETMEKLLTESLTLPVADKNYALQAVGRHQQAWQQAQQEIGVLTDKVAEKQLRKNHVNQHPNKTHSVRTQQTTLTQWNINRLSLDYYAPHYNGYYRLGTDFQQADAQDILGNTPIDDEFRLRGGFHWQQNESTWAIKADVAQGVGDQRIGILGEFRTQFTSYLSGGFKLGVNNHLEASQLMTIAGQDNVLGVNINYQPTARENLAMQVSFHDLSTRFGDDIGRGWDMNIRASEQFFFNDPAWQIYSEYSMQQVKHSNSKLKGVNAWQQGPRPLTPSDFIAERYQRLSIGHRLWHGEPGIPGATVPSPRYWLDNSVGYNVEAQQMDMMISAGLGWRITGNDELYMGVDWQSQDRNGDESLKVAFGYYYSF
ncbi:tetratricopeptide repeat protein [Photobacterium sanguinicancri]|uniref:tetratricopeptide repeat protein n=1 Tax=Photobacterium sanguinicancri TaxID=875932 RepID=UPI0026E1A3CE|nr:tetratricopeptide repeat protein [Photobacterium sanguinicancri]MDO6498104.1 tetratricopeptide repeat protein [Photobacterium sanguinicancri]